MVDTLRPVAVTLLTTSNATIYTVPAATKAVVAFIRVVNTTGNSATVNVHVVPSGGSPSATNAIMYEFTVPANDFIDSAKGMMLAAEDFISAKASNSSTINIKTDLIESA